MAADLAFVTAPDGRAAIVGPGIAHGGPTPELVVRFAELDGSGPVRWAWWSAGVDAREVVTARVPVTRCWDIAEAHRVLRGGWQADPQLCWATAQALDLERQPAQVRGDLFDDFTGVTEGVVRPDGYLEPAAGRPGWHPDDAALVAWGRAALECAERQATQLAQVGPRALSLAHSESAAAFLCVELARDGLPVDRAVAGDLIAAAAGPRPRDESDAREIRAARDSLVLRHVPGHERGRPAQPGPGQGDAGIGRSGRAQHPQVGARALSADPSRGRRPARVAQGRTHRHDLRVRLARYPCRPGRPAARRVDGVRRGRGADDGARTGCTTCPQTCARRWPPSRVMSSSVPTSVRSSPGCSRPCRRTRPSPPPPGRTISTRRSRSGWGVERPVAKVAVLAAMYGQRSGAAGEALKGLERAYPVAMTYLDQAYAAGLRREPLRTYGGRLIRLDAILADAPADGAAAYDAARGRFARNAVIQGSAAELFKAWAATVRATTRDLGAQIVLCLHDELLVHVPEQHAQEVRRRLVLALDDSARRWSGTTRVRFVADASVIRRWSEAKE